MRKPSMKKQPSELMKKCRKQLNKTQEYYRVSMSRTYNNDGRQVDHHLSKRKTSHVMLVPHTNNLACSSTQSNGIKSSHENIDKSMPSSSRISRKNTDISRHYSLEPNNGVVSFGRTAKSSSSPNNGIIYLQNDVEKSTPSSSRPKNHIDSPKKNTNGGAITFKNIEKPRTTSSRLNNSTEASPSENIEMPRSSSSRKNNHMVSLPTKIKKPNNGMLSFGRNNESLKSRPSRLRDGISSVLKDDSSSRLGISNVSHPSSMLRKSRITSHIVNDEVQKEDISMVIETLNPSLKSKGSQANTGIRHVSLLGKNLSSRQMAEVPCMVSNQEGHAESKGKHIQLDTKRLSIGLSEDGGTDDDKIKRTWMEEKLETHEDSKDSEVEIRRLKKIRKFITHGDDEDDGSAQNLVCAEKGTAGFTEAMDSSIQLKDQSIRLVEDGGDISGNSRKRIEQLPGENPKTHEDNDSEEPDSCRPKKRRRKLILNDYDEDGDQNRAGVEISTARLTKETVVVKECSTEVSSPFLSASLMLQQYGSMPIDEPVWSGTINISSNKNISLAAHLSTKCCEEAWNLAESLQQEIVVTKLPTLEAWPKSFEASRPTDDNIALYFLPCKMRQDADLDQLVKEVVENDMVLQAVIGEAEMLIFPSILLPEQHKTFQGKPYLWAVFKRRKSKVATVEAQHGRRHCAQEEIGEQ
ncbi:hypothetical protein ACQ4PT_068061 [Festuca glaucescens]